MREVFDALETWFRSGTAGVIILALLFAGTSLYAGARLSSRFLTSSRFSRALEVAAFIALAFVGILLVVGAPFNE